jgi:hypothetical protein
MYLDLIVSKRRSLEKNLNTRFDYTTDLRNPLVCQIIDQMTNTVSKDASPNESFPPCPHRKAPDDK